MIDKLKYFCNKILPLVYDDSLSYYETLCKVSDKLNETIDSTNGLLDAWNAYKNDIDKAFGEYTASLDEKFETLTKKIGKDFDEYRAVIREMLLEAFAEQNAAIRDIKDTVSDQNAKITEITNEVNAFIEKYNAEIAKIPQLVQESVLAWLADTTNYDNIIADLSGQIQGVKHFDTVADMVASTYTQIVGKEICVCLNYYSNDGVFTMWEIVPFNTAPGVYADGVGKKQLAYTDTDLTYRVAVLRSEYTASTLGVATAPTATERASAMIQICRFSGTYSPIKIDMDFSVSLSDINTTTKTLSVYSDKNNRHTITLTGNNNFISNFTDVDVMHNINNITHSTDKGVHFDNCNILSNAGATVIMSNIDIKNCYISCSQIQCTDTYAAEKYVFNNNTWIANTIFGVVLSNANVNSVEMLELVNNYVQNTSATRTRLLLSPQTPAKTVNILDNVIYNASISTDTPVADGILCAITSIGTEKNFTLNVKDNIVYTSTAKSIMTLGRSSDSYIAFTMLYKDNIIMLNKSTSTTPENHSILSTEITTNGKFYTNFIGDLDTSALIKLDSTAYIGGDIGKVKTIPFSPTTSIGYQPETDGTLSAPESEATYRAELDIVCAGATASQVSQYITVSFGGVGASSFLTGQPVQRIIQTLYLTPSDLASLGGVLSLTVQSSGSIATVGGTVKLFRMA